MNVKHIMTWPVFSIGPDATVLQAVQLMLRHKISGVPVVEYVVAAILSGVAAYASARFLLRYFRSGRLDPYGIYCIAAGLISLALLHFNL